jgi:hypothetical protein
LIENETNERRTSNVQHRTSNNVFCQFKKKIEQQAEQPPALREHIYPLKFDAPEPFG